MPTGGLPASQATTVQASVDAASSTTRGAAEPPGCREQLPNGLGAAHGSSNSMATTNTATSSSSMSHGFVPTCSRCGHAGHSSRQCRRTCSSCGTRQGHTLGCRSLWCVNCSRQGHTFEVCSQVPTSTEQASAASGPAANTAEATAAPAGAYVVTSTSPALPAGATSLATGSDDIPCPLHVAGSPAALQGAAAQAAGPEKERFQRLLQAAAASFAAGSTADCSRTAPFGETGVSRQPGRAMAYHSGMHDQAQPNERPSLDGGDCNAAVAVSSSNGGGSARPSAGAGPDVVPAQDSAGCAARVSQQVSAEPYCWYDVPVMQDQRG